MGIFTINKKVTDSLNHDKFARTLFHRLDKAILKDRFYNIFKRKVIRYN